MEFTLPLTEMSTRKCLWGVNCGRRIRLTNSPHSELNWVYLTADGQSTSSFWYRAPLWGPWPDFYPYPFFSDNCFVVLPVGRHLWREDGIVTYSAIAGWSGHWGPITIHFRLIWDCVPFSSPRTTRRDYGGGIPTRLHTGVTAFCEPNVYNMWDPRHITAL
jgi:hypothetical protein